MWKAGRCEVECPGSNHQCQSGIPHSAETARAEDSTVVAAKNASHARPNPRRFFVFLLPLFSTKQTMPSVGRLLLKLLGHQSNPVQLNFASRSL